MERTVQTRETLFEQARDRSLSERYRQVREFTDRLCQPLQAEDCAIQSMADASPTKWHLAHTTWFFETFFLPRAMPGYRPFDPAFAYLFNSYYNSVGAQFPRPRRGLLSRPTLEQVRQYRKHVDAIVLDTLSSPDDPGELAGVFELGLNHEQQHQELILTDIKHVFSCNPLRPVAYGNSAPRCTHTPEAVRWFSWGEGLHRIGYEGQGFAFDNEGPRHCVFLQGFDIADRPVTNGEYIAFIEDLGYTRPELWLSAGWDLVRAAGWQAPLYWEKQGGEWFSPTLSGYGKVEPGEPVCHVSYFEADAFARWKGARLPKEAEWEVAASGVRVDGNFAEDERYHPQAAPAPDGVLRQVFGDVWEWTGSSYAPYPGYAPVSGALGEYNGKFMCNQMVLRGGSCATPRSHIRATYRNFFPPEARWQFTGIRLARDCA